MLQSGSHHSTNNLRYHQLAPIQNARRCCPHCRPKAGQQWFSLLRKLDSRLWNIEFYHHNLLYLMILLQEERAAGDNFTPLPPSKLCMCATITVPNLHTDPSRICKRVWEKQFSTFNHHEIEWSWTRAWANQVRCLWQASIVMCVDHPDVFCFVLVCFFFNHLWLLLNLCLIFLLTSLQPCKFLIHLFM